ncbi:hypothetical protein ACFQ3S_11705 [Mucilaginibacter terrae]|uniref:hypothetical protein n=1 Tax=Mucilaginibacter terrae TaxID=1955052 RepID=UPI00362C8290
MMMKKYGLLLLLLPLIHSTLKAQERNTKALSIGPELNLLQRSAYNIGYGVSGKFELPVSSTISAVITAGINQFHRKNFLIGSASQGNDTFVPLKAGIKYYFDPRFYTEAELGSVIDHNNGFNQNLFAYSIGTGFLIPINKSSTNMIDLGLRFEDWAKNRAQQFGIRVAYRFGW